MSISSAPWGSALVLTISYAFIKMLGNPGLTYSTKIAILNANYIKEKLSKHFEILYSGENNRVAHEMIVDFRMFKKDGIEVIDVAKRLMDYGFHATTISFPVPGTLMIEPTESESKEELDRFCEAMISISDEIDKIKKGKFDPIDNPIKNAPHTIYEISSDVWEHKYSRQEAVFPHLYLLNNNDTLLFILSEKHRFEIK